MEIKNLGDFSQHYTWDTSQPLDPKGQGGIYLATNPETQQEAALKIVEVPAHLDQGLLLDRYTTARGLAHPNLLPYWAVYRLDEGATIYNMVLMPYIEGRSLEAAGALSEADRGAVWRGVLAALGYLHRRGLAHQNLHHSHVLLRRVGDEAEPLLIQYGTKNRLPMSYLASWEYAAPEQFDIHQPVDARTDIWAWGVLGYWLWTGKLPFGQKSPTLPNRKLQNRILEDELPSLVSEIPAPYRQVVERCLRKEPSERWQSVEEIEAALDAPVVEVSQGAESQENAPLVADEKPSRTFKRTPSKPLVWWQILLGLVAAALAGWLVNRYF